jgi:hypothetical protein
MIVEIRTEAAQFLFREYINLIFGTECTPASRSCTPLYLTYDSTVHNKGWDIYPHLTLDTVFPHVIPSPASMAGRQTQLTPPDLYLLLVPFFLHSLQFIL